MTSIEEQNARIAVLIPCYNKEVTIAKVVADFKRELPGAAVYVYDNNSSDRTRGMMFSGLSLSAGSER